LEILSAGDCPDSQPCPSCFQIIVTNNNATTCPFTYYNCDSNQYVTQSLGPNTATSINCACPTIESKCNLDVVVGTQCSGPTPTPTPTCSYKEWSVTTANVICDGDVYVCSSLASRLVYTDCTVTDIFADNTSIYENSSLSFPWTGYFLDGTDIYESTWLISGDVTFIGICGASCQ
jgi:hypothetical protein